ncbi:class I SAM-dependent methyltransferase [Novosphingobium percolationis]|uniref:class I SAM-dependent methyltransferase n=1 Tax=Novosphingobium percolationis TaxID=2871811 RepID=UPI001CD634B7|nr:SAM-dependent methyltransferase [Novosphingobium percolationis]
MSEPLRRVFERLIVNTGPISVAHYMAESNARYYDSRDPLGSGGDFVTAPEISQMFGELLGLWLADIWIRAGRPAPAHYVELGPGRGTLARDALQAARRFGLETRPHFVEGSTALKAAQLDLHPDAVWHADLSTLPTDGPLLIVANEFLDALPVRQLVKAASGWRERMVGLVDGRLAPIVGDRPMDAAIPADRRDAPEGAILETCPAAAAVLYEVAGRLASQGGAALFIDYGHAEPRLGSSLQAVRAHRMVDPFAAPGEADLTAHVDFSALAPIAQSRGVRWLGTVEQGRFLRLLGIDARADALARAQPDEAAAIATARDRLIGEGQMGALFKVMGLAAAHWPEGAGF